MLRPELDTHQHNGTMNRTGLGPEESDGTMDGTGAKMEQDSAPL